MEAPGTQRPNVRLKNQSQEPHRRNSVEEKYVRFLTVESLVTHMMENGAQKSYLHSADEERRKMKVSKKEN